MLRRLLISLFMLIILYEFALNSAITLGVMFGHDDQQLPEMDRWMNANPLGEYTLYGCLVLIWGQFAMLSGKKSRAWIGLMAYHLWFYSLGLWCGNRNSGFFELFVGRGEGRHAWGWGMAVCSGVAIVLLITSVMRQLVFGLPSLFPRRMPSA